MSKEYDTVTQHIQIGDEENMACLRIEVDIQVPKHTGEPSTDAKTEEYTKMLLDSAQKAGTIAGGLMLQALLKTVQEIAIKNEVPDRLPPNFN